VAPDIRHECGEFPILASEIFGHHSYLFWTTRPQTECDGALDLHLLPYCFRRHQIPSPEGFNYA
jgi:hypothetical protein